MSEAVFFPTPNPDVFLSEAGEFHLRNAETGRMSNQAWSTMKDALYAAYERQLGNIVAFMQEEVREFGQMSNLLELPPAAEPVPASVIFDTAALLIHAVMQFPSMSVLMQAKTHVDTRREQRLVYLADALSYELYHCNALELSARIDAEARGVAA